MSESTVRPIEAIQQEYVQTCTKAGDLQYKIDVFKKDLETLNKRLRELNFEAVASQEASAKAAAEAKAAEEAAKAVAAPSEVSSG